MASQVHLPERIETVGLESPLCPSWGEALDELPGTEDSEVLEIEVKAYRRLIRRQRYRPSCRCCCVPGIVTAPAPNRLIERRDALTALDQPDRFLLELERLARPHCLRHCRSHCLH